MSDTIELRILGFIGGGLIVVSMLPQLYKIMSSKSVKDISVSTYILLLIAQVLWMAYGIIKSDLQITLTNIFSGVINLIIICATVYFKKCDDSDVSL